MAESGWSSRRLHFVGIGGAGMSGLALIAHALGAHVSGSDRAESSYTERLREHGIQPVVGTHSERNVPEGAELVYSTAVPPDNPERVAAGPRQLHRADLLAEIAALRRCLAVTGTHGKTTTAGMIVHAMQGAGHDPSYVVGGELRNTGANAGWGAGEWIVVEADESDRSLLKLDPEVAVLTNAELDHHSTYSSLLELEETLRLFMARARADVVWDRPRLRALCAPDARVYDVPDPELCHDGSRFCWRGLEVVLSVPGAHNAINAAGALEAAALAGVDLERAASSLRNFQGARRRFEALGRTRSGALVYDDYAHHPTEVAAAIAAARTLRPARVVAVFQPHLFSRTAALAAQFGRALAAADIAVLLDVYPARERAEDFPGVDGRVVAEAAADAADGRRVAWLPSFGDARQFLNALLRAEDLCLLMGAGNIDALALSLVGSGASASN
jgi:UDP-N-acetylmuramate--alanine ligase